MGFIQRCIMGSVYAKHSDWYFDRYFSHEYWELLSTINQNQRSRWKKKGIIPWQILRILYLWGLVPADEPPSKGMKVERFLVVMRMMSEKAPDKNTRETAEYLYEDTMKSEYLPDWRKNLYPRKSTLRVKPKRERPRTNKVDLTAYNPEKEVVP